MGVPTPKSVAIVPTQPGTEKPVSSETSIPATSASNNSAPEITLVEADTTQLKKEASTPKIASTPKPENNGLTKQVSDKPTPSSELVPPATLTFTPEQEQQIGEVAKKYLLDNPEVLLEVTKNLQVKQREQRLASITAAVLEHHDGLLSDPSTPSFGPAEADVSVVEFFDYQCSVCAHEAPVIDALMKANPQVRFIFKEWPIFGSRWPESMNAAETGLQIWTQKGEEAYMTYHNAIFASGHIEGKLEHRDIAHASATIGKLKGSKTDMLGALAQTDALAQNLGFRGTPGLVVMPVTGATADNITVFPGGASQETLQAALNKARGK
jgi:protein-disulfide isomerase